MKRAEPFRLNGARVMLRPLTSRDFAGWREVRIDSRAWLERWEPHPEPGAPDVTSDPDAFRGRCHAWDRQRQFDSAYGFGLFRLADEQFMGEVSIGSVARGPFQSGSVGYWIDRREAGRGYVPEAVAVLMQYAFETLELHRLEVAIVPRNLPSRRVAEKLGLREEGVARAFLQIAGRYEDHVRYALTVEEYEARRDDFAALISGGRVSGTSRPTA